MARVIVQEVVVGATKKLILLFTFILLLEKMALATTKFELMNNFMYQSGKGGKQVIDGSGDQQLNIVEPVFYLESDISKNTHLFGSALVDLWSSASEAIFDSTTGASGRALGDEERVWQERIGFDLGVSQKIKTWTILIQIQIGKISILEFRF